MPLNYSKWDQLELSDDSDIEGHPNVDKRSLIRWKQRDIHEKREQRKYKIAGLQAEIACNEVLLPRLRALHATLLAPPAEFPSASAYFNSVVSQLRNAPSPAAPPTNAPGQMSYDEMVLNLLLQVGEAARGDEAGLGERLAEGLKAHVERLATHTEGLRKELAAEEKEQKKHITSDDLHEGFESKYVPPKPAPPPVPLVKIDEGKKKTTTKTATKTEFEVLNPGAGASTSAAPAAPAPADDDSDDDDDSSLPQLTPSLEEFSRIPLRAYERSFHFIQEHRDVIVPGASDALLVAGFRAQNAGQPLLAKQCVHQSLLLQYCEKLGTDGVRVFFKKMMSGDKRAEKVFVDDVEGTYNHLLERVRASIEEAPGQEQIQLVPENADQTISFNVPDGPPPDELVLEGPGTEDMDVEEVRKALQFRWAVFESFPEELQAALRDGSLEAVNKVLGEMEVPLAEEVVQKLDAGGILSFAEGGVRDETAKGRKEVEARLSAA